MLLLNEFQERFKIGPSEVVNRLEAGKHRLVRQTLEVIFTNVLNVKEKDSTISLTLLIKRIAGLHHRHLPASLSANRIYGRTAL